MQNQLSSLWNENTTNILPHPCSPTSYPKPLWERYKPHCHLPPKVAEMSMCVPYFLMMVSMNCCVVGLLPSRRMLLWNSGIRGTGLRSRSLRSMAVFLTFQRANSLSDNTGTQQRWGSKSRQERQTTGEMACGGTQRGNIVQLHHILRHWRDTQAHFQG